MQNIEKGLPYFMVIFVLALGACGGETSASPPVTPPAISVTIDNANCPSIEVQSGMQVAWTNGSSVSRVVQAEALADGSREFDSGELQPGGYFIFTFMKSGSYTYQCSTDGTLKGTVTVRP